MWAATGSEAVQKAIWAALYQPATGQRHHPGHRTGFHGKKGLAGAVTGTEKDPEPQPARALHQLSDRTSARASSGAGSRSI